MWLGACCFIDHPLCSSDAVVLHVSLYFRCADDKIQNPILRNHRVPILILLLILERDVCNVHIQQVLRRTFIYYPNCSIRFLRHLYVLIFREHLTKGLERLPSIARGCSRYEGTTRHVFILTATPSSILKRPREMTLSQDIYDGLDCRLVLTVGMATEQQNRCQQRRHDVPSHHPTDHTLKRVGDNRASHSLIATNRNRDGISRIPGAFSLQNLYPGFAAPVANLAARKTFSVRAATVTGPTPPGTGVM